MPFKRYNQKDTNHIYAPVSPKSRRHIINPHPWGSFFVWEAGASPQNEGSLTLAGMAMNGVFSITLLNSVLSGLSLSVLILVTGHSFLNRITILLYHWAPTNKQLSTQVTKTSSVVGTQHISGSLFCREVPPLELSSESVA